MPTKVPSKVAAAYVPARRQATSKMLDNALAVLTRGVIPTRPKNTETDIPVLDDTKIPKGATCQEASMHSRGSYIPCGNLASAIVHHPKDKRSYYMCAPCASHNVKNRGGILKFYDFVTGLEAITKNVKSGSPTGRLGTSKPELQNIPLPKPAKPSADKNPFSAKPAKSDSFPLVSVLARPDMDRVIEIMKDDTQLAEEIEGLLAARASMKKELAEIATRTEHPGFTWGPFVAYARGMKTKRTFSASLAKTIMVEEGIHADRIEECYTESDPFPDVRIVDTSKPKKVKAGKTGSQEGEEDE